MTIELDSGSIVNHPNSAIIAGTVYIYQGTIEGGEFHGLVDNSGTIKGGDFINAKVKNKATIEGGEFHDVNNAPSGYTGTIKGGYFRNEIGDGIIQGGMFSVEVDCDTTSCDRYDINVNHNDYYYPYLIAPKDSHVHKNTGDWFAPLPTDSAVLTGGATT